MRATIRAGDGSLRARARADDGGDYPLAQRAAEEPGWGDPTTDRQRAGDRTPPGPPGASAPTLPHASARRRRSSLSPGLHLGPDERDFTGQAPAITAPAGGRFHPQRVARGRPMSGVPALPAAGRAHRLLALPTRQDDPRPLAVNRRRRAYRPGELPERLKEAGRPLPGANARLLRRRPRTGSEGAPAPGDAGLPALGSAGDGEGAVVPTDARPVPPSMEASSAGGRGSMVVVGLRRRARGAGADELDVAQRAGLDEPPRSPGCQRGRPRCRPCR